MLEKLEVEVDKKGVENYYVCQNLRHFIIPLCISIFIISGEITGAFANINIDFTKFHKYIAFILIASIVMYMFSLLQAKMLKYEVKDGVLCMESGVFYRTLTRVPLEQITDIEIYSGILEKVLGVQLMKVQTAGRGAHIRKW